MEWLSNACDVIILIGAVCLATERITSWFGKPINIFRKKHDSSLEGRVTRILEKILPKMLEEHDLATRDRYLKDRLRYLNEIKSEILEEINAELNKVTDLSKQYDILVLSAKDVLREKIMQIYFKGKKDKEITMHDHEALEQYYKDYKAMKGNSYIDKYYNRMKNWNIIDDDYSEE